MNKCLVLASILWVFNGFSNKIQAQQDVALHFMSIIPQAGYSNPSALPQYRISFGLPFLSSNYLSLSNNGFAYSDFVRRGTDDDSLRRDYDNVISVLNDQNYLTFHTDLDLFSLRLNVKNFTIGTSITEKIAFRFSYPKDLISLLVYGNEYFYQKTTSFDGLGFDLSHYREYAVEAGYRMKKLSLGGRMKMLYGKANISTAQSSLSLYTDTFTVTATSNLLINTSGLDFGGDSTGFDVGGYVFNTDNSGMAFDIGATYRLNDRILVSANAVDIGSIQWKSGNINYSNDNASFTFNGFDLDNLISPSEGDTSNALNELRDSLISAFQLNKTNEAYKTSLPMRIYLGGSFLLNKNNRFNALIYAEDFENQWRPSYSVSYNRKIGKMFHLAMSYSVLNGTFNNLGGGFALMLGPAQWYFFGDNLMGVFLPQHTKSANVRMGINFVFGQVKEKKKKDQPKFQKSTTKAQPEFKIEEKKEETDE